MVKLPKTAALDDRLPAEVVDGMESRRGFSLWRLLNGAARRVEAVVAAPRWSMAWAALLLLGAVLAGFFIPDGGSSPLLRAVAEKAAEPARRLGLHDPGRARWFVALEVLLLLGLAACLLRRVCEAWQDLRWPVLLETPEQIRECAWSRTVFHADTGARWAVARHEAVLRARHWRVRVLDGDGGTVLLYAEYGRWGRLGSLMLHAGVLLAVAAAVIVPFTRHVERVETVAYRILPLSDTGFPCDMQVGDVVLEPVRGGRAADCRVSVAMVERGLQLPPHEVRTGFPLHYRGMTVYLGEWGHIVDLRVQDGRKERLLSVRDGGGFNLPGMDGWAAVWLSPNLETLSYRVDRAEDEPSTGILSAGESAQIGGTKLTFEGRRPYAVLMVKREAGTGLAVAGVALFLGGFLLGRILRLRRVWAVAEQGDGGATVHLGGDAPDDEDALAGLAARGPR